MDEVTDEAGSAPIFYDGRSSPLLRTPAIDIDFSEIDDEESGENTEAPDSSPVHKQQRKRGLRAKQILSRLDARVMGQEKAKLLLSVLFSMHENRKFELGNGARPPNAIVVGPTGVGKTFALRVASESLNMPFLTIDTTTLGPMGGTALKLPDIVGQLIVEAENLLERKPELRSSFDAHRLAARGVIFFDEFDKIAVPPDTTGGNSNQSWLLMLQRSLLKLFEGAKVPMTSEGPFRRPKNDVFDSSGVLIIAGGAFSNISEPKIRQKRPVGLSKEWNAKGIISHDFIAFGIIPELVARLQVIVEFSPLDFTTMRRILEKGEESPLRVWQAHLSPSKKLSFTKDALDYATNLALLLDLGARGLSQILFPALANMTFDLEKPGRMNIEITQADLERALKGSVC